MGMRYAVGSFGLVLLCTLMVLMVLGIPAGLSIVTLLALVVLMILLPAYPLRWVKFIRPALAKSKPGVFQFTLYALCAFFLQCPELHERALTFLTGFHPFSLFFTDRLSHARYSGFRRLVSEIERYSLECKMPIRIRGVAIDSGFTEIHAVRGNISAHMRHGFISRLETALQQKYPTVFVRGGHQGFRILVPTSELEGSVLPYS